MVAGGEDGCQAGFSEITGRNFTDVRFGRFHNLIVDIYALQHPARYCVSAKSLAAHLCGLCNVVERGSETAMPNMTLRRWLDGATAIEKPPLPDDRGEMTIADIAELDDPSAFAITVKRWGENVWEAYRPLHAIARPWLDEALASSPIKRKHAKR